MLRFSAFQNRWDWWWQNPSGTVSATLTMEAGDEEVAGHISAIGSGLISLMKLQKEKPEAVKFAESLVLKQEGNKVLVQHCDARQRHHRRHEG